MLYRITRRSLRYFPGMEGDISGWNLDDQSAK